MAEQPCTVHFWIGGEPCGRLARWFIPVPDDPVFMCNFHAEPYLTPSADLPACRDEDPATPARLAAAYPDPPEYQHPEDDGGAFDMAPGYGGWDG